MSVQLAEPVIPLPCPRPIRVCYLIDTLTLAGTEIQLLALIRHLNRDRCIPHLCLLNGSAATSRGLEPTDCPVLRLEVASFRNVSTLSKAWQFARFLRENRIDVLQTYFPDSTYFGTLLGRLAGVPVIVRTRNNLSHWLTPKHRWLERIVRNFVSYTLTNCAPARDALLRAEGGRATDVLVLENGLDLERFQDVPSLEPEGPTFNQVGIVAGLRDVKRIDLLVRAIALVKKKIPHVKLNIAGDGDERQRLQSLVRENALSENVVFHGAVQDVPGFLQQIQIAVLCSAAEAMSNSLLEYMGSGRAIVATDVGAARKLLQEGQHGLLVSPGNVEQLADAISKLASNPRQAVELGRSARDHVWAHYGRDSMVRRFENLYCRWMWKRGQ